LRLRYFGRIALLLVVLLLVADSIRNLPQAAEPLGEGPEGFPWPTRGLGEITLGMEGRFLLDLEERIETQDGAALRVPKMSLAGSDPRPRDEGMLTSDAVIRSFASTQVEPTEAQEPQARVIVHAPEAWMPMSVAADGTRELDRTRPWRFKNPEVLLPALGGKQEFLLQTAEAELDPITNEVFCPGAFTLSSAGLRFEGTGLRLSPDDDRVRFGETDGRIAWQLEMETGGVLRGFSDGGGELYAISENRSAIEMHAEQLCWIELPLESGLPGRLETDGFLLGLRNRASASTQDSNQGEPQDEPSDRWAPQTLDGLGTTFWSGGTRVLQGGASAVDWNETGELIGLLIDGPILARVLGQVSGWNTAQGGAHIDAANGELSLWDRVVARAATASVYADRTTVDANKVLQADGDLVVVSPHGLSFAEDLTSSGQQEQLWLSQVTGYPNNAEVDRIEAPRMRAGADQSAEIPANFVLRGQLEEEAWKFEGARLESHLDSAGRQVASARGGVTGTVGAANWKGETLNLRESRLALRGYPCEVDMPLEAGGRVFGTAEHANLVEGVLRLQGAPQVRVPAATLGLAGEFLHVQARHVERQADGSWFFEHDVIFSGACEGSARRVTWFADGRFLIERASDDATIIAHRADGSRVSLRARTIDGHTDGPVLLSSAVDLEFDPGDGEPALHLTGTRAIFATTGGTIEGPVTIQQGEREAAAQRVEWTGDPRAEPYLVHFYGEASFATPEGAGRAHRMRYDSRGDALELFRGRRAAWLQLSPTRELEADWFRYGLSDRLVQSRSGTVVPSDPEDRP
jgi:hypothetical protein